MRHFIAYQTDREIVPHFRMKHVYDGLSIWSPKSFRFLQNTIGHRMWMVRGVEKAGSRRKYYLHSYYTVEAVWERESLVWVVSGTEGFLFDIPVELNAYDWFHGRERLSVFGNGLREMKHADVTAGLMRIAATFPKTLKTAVIQKSHSSTQTQHKRDKDLLPEEIGDDVEMLIEGAVTTAKVNSYERNARARKRCIEHYGLDCFICGFNFKQAYGNAGDGTIHVHHLKLLSEVKKSYRVDPIKDLRPVCPNCHAMIHNRYPMYTAAEIEKMLGRKKHSSKN